MAAACRQSGGKGAHGQKSAGAPENVRQKGHNRRAAARNEHLNAGITAGFDDNEINGIVAFGL
jgi:hypothetical protein